MSSAAKSRLAPGVIVGWLARGGCGLFLQRGLVLRVELLPPAPRGRGIRCGRCWSEGCDLTVHVLPIGSTQPYVTCSGRRDLQRQSDAPSELRAGSYVPA